MSSTVTVGGFDVTSNTPAAEVAASLTSTKEGAPVPEIVRDQGRTITPEDKEKAKLAEAASELGKEGGKAAAAKRAEAAKEKGKEAAPAGKEATPPAEAEPAAKDEKDEDRKSRAKQRVEEATRELAAAKRETAAERVERERLEARVAELERAQPKREAAPADSRPAPASRDAAPADDPKPKVEDFETYEDFVEAKARHAAREEFRTHQRKADAQGRAAAYWRGVETRADKFNERVAGVPGDDPQHQAKFDEFMAGISTDVASLRVTADLKPGERPGPRNMIADEIFNSEQAPALMQHFTKHPEDLQRIAALRSPRDVLREMAKLEARVEGATAGNPPPTGRPMPKSDVSMAPPPVSPVTGAPHIAEEGYRPGMSFDDYARGWKQPKTAQR
jgi:hypothetical protein